MMRIKAVVRLIFIEICAIVTLSQGVGQFALAQVQESDALIPEEVKHAIAHFSEVKSLSVSWTQHSEDASADSQQRSTSTPSSPGKARIPDSHRLTWQNGKMYGRRISSDPTGTHTFECAFDGRILAGGCPDRMDNGKRTLPSLLIEVASNMDAKGDYFGVVFLDPLGLWLPHGPGELLKGMPLQSHLQKRLASNGHVTQTGTVVIDGHSTTRLVITGDNADWQPVPTAKDLVELTQFFQNDRSLSKEEVAKKVALAKRAAELMPRQLQYVYYLDPVYGYAVRRYEEIGNDGRLRRRSNCTEHQKLPEYEIWLAKKCITDFYVADGTYPGKVFDAPLLTESAEVTEFSTKVVGADVFTLKYTVAGTTVVDKSLPESKFKKDGVTYRVPANPEDLDAAIEDAKSMARTNYYVSVRSRIVRVSLVVGFFGVLALLVFRRKRKASKV
jgi:hypothetical protein